MTNKDEGARQSFDQAAKFDREQHLAKLSEADRESAQAVIDRYERQAEREVERYEKEKPQEVAAETARLALWQSSPELSPPDSKRKLMSYEQLCNLAESNCDRRHEAALLGIEARCSAELETFTRGRAGDSAADHIPEDSADLSQTFTQHAQSPKDREQNSDFGRYSDESSSEIESGDFYRGEVDHHDGRER
ncbi:hypothetical protein VLK31_27440 [Variovorax sp. H27-G14]|uniref:hypothetical protein n=1 Tax=Variovorax sp. H27-G14 TaxID=3111914 RepID=UPI0038FC1F69